MANMDFFEAVRKGNLEEVQQHITNGININEELSSSNNETALYIAIENKQYDVAKTLIEAGANAKKVNDYNVPPIMMAVFKSKTDPDFLPLISLLAPHSDIYQTDKFRGKNTVEACLDEDNAPALKILIEEGHYNINEQNSSGWTLAMKCAFENADNCLQEAFKHGADPNTKNELGQTILIISIWANKKHGVEKCLEQTQTNLNIQDNEGKTAVIHAAKLGFPEKMKMLLDAGADVNISDVFGQNAVIWATLGNKIECIQTLALEQYHADFSKKDINGKTPLEHAFEQGYDECSKLIRGITGIPEPIITNSKEPKVKKTLADIMAKYKAPVEPTPSSQSKVKETIKKDGQHMERTL